MGRGRNDDIDYELGKMEVARKEDVAKTKLLQAPSEKGFTEDVKAKIEWEGLKKTRYDLIKAIESSVAKLGKLILAKEQAKVYDAEYVALVREYTKHAVSLGNMIDKASQTGFFEASEHDTDNGIELIIRHEAE